MYKAVKPGEIKAEKKIAQFPHCDARVLHAPGECEYCDRHPDWQELRMVWGIAFTGYTPENKELPCPADHARGNTHTLWGGNVAKKPGQSIGNMFEPIEPEE